MSALLGHDPTDTDLASICDWIDDGVTVLCPQGMRALARGVRRLLHEKHQHTDLLGRLLDHSAAGYHEHLARRSAWSGTAGQVSKGAGIMRP